MELFTYDHPDDHPKFTRIPQILFLIEEGAPLNVIAELQGERVTALEIAYRYDIQPIIQALEEKGAKRYKDIKDDGSEPVIVLEFTEEMAEKVDYR